jgi:GNAT superfamily N-acetyltransferase
MFVRREYRGARHGVAERLLATLIEWSAVQRIREVFLGTTAQFLAAHRFYEKHGFVQVDRELLPAAFPIMAVDTRFYLRTLPTPSP